MLKVEYKEIVSHLHNIIKGSDFEGHVYVVGGAVRSEIISLYSTFNILLKLFVTVLYE